VQFYFLFTGIDSFSTAITTTTTRRVKGRVSVRAGARAGARAGIIRARRPGQAPAYKDGEL
jgi:hypothetical protein